MIQDRSFSEFTHVIKASAGTGKTTRLLQTVLLDLLNRNRNQEDSRSIRTSLVITFTNAAAAEMRRRLDESLRFAIDYAEQNGGCESGGLKMRDRDFRIGGDDGELARTIREDPGNAIRVFNQALNDLPSAQISTIDSLSKHIVDRNAEVLPDAQPGMRILADTGMCNELRDSVLTALFEQWYGEDDSFHGRFMDLLENFGGARNDARLRTAILELYETAITKSSHVAWLAHISEPYDITFSETLPVYGVSSLIDLYIDRNLAEFEKAYAKEQEYLQYIQKQVDVDWKGSEFEGERVATLRYFKPLESPFIRDLSRNMRVMAWRDLSGKFHDGGGSKSKGTISDFCSSDINGDSTMFHGGKKMPLKYHVQKNKEDDLDKERYCGEAPRECDFEDVNGEAARIVGAVQKPLKRLASLVALSCDETNRFYRTMKCRLDTLYQCVRWFDGEYGREKKRLRLADFSDVAHWALDILSDDDGVADRVRGQWTHIYVDESQDDNDLQNTFIRRLAKNAEKLTMVGDVKQSIYGFRDASPDEFVKIVNETKPEFRDALWTNYRSRPEILTFVNAVFDGLMTEGMGKVDYRDERLHIRPGGDDADEALPFDPTAVEFLLCSLKLANTSTAEIEQRDSAPQKQTDMIVDRIIGLVEHEGYDYGDIAVLSYGSRYFGDLAERLLAQDIPVDVVGVGDFYRKPEIVLAVNWLRVINNARQDVPLVTVLRGVGFSDDDLARLRLLGKGGFHGLLGKAAHDDEADLPASLRDRCRAFLALLDDLRDYARTHPVDALLWHLFAVTGLFDYVGRLPDGVQRTANLESLCDKAKTFGAAREPGLRAFLDAVDSWKNIGDAGDEASTTATTNAVHITTIHKAKGLQWPVVILMNAATSNINHSLTPDVLVLPNDAGTYGVAGMDFANAGQDIKIGTVQRAGLLELSDRREAAERLRLLYVALTRPERKLIIAGTYMPEKKAKNDGFRPRSYVDSMWPAPSDGGEFGTLDPSMMVKESTYLSWIFRGLVAGPLSVGGSLVLTGAWDGVPADGKPYSLPIPQEPGLSAEVSRPGLCVTVTCHDGWPQDPTQMTESTPGYAYTRKRLDVTGIGAEETLRRHDSDTLARIPSAVNASGARAWLALATPLGDGTDDGPNDVEEKSDEVEAVAEGLDDNTEASAWRTHRLDLPAFMLDHTGSAPAGSGTEVSPAELGTGAHAALELFDWHHADGVEECRQGLLAAIGRLEDSGMTSEPVARTLRGDGLFGGLLWFVTGGESDSDAAGAKVGIDAVGAADAASEEALRSLVATIRTNPDRLFREMPFSSLMDVSRLDIQAETERNPGITTADDGGVVVRGVIDGFVVDDETKSIILFDYKTDRLRPGENVDQWARRLHDDYAQQQALYAEALERLYPGYTVTGRWLIGLAAHRLIDVGA
ncbi:UvrD-helicase domain-containing protein [Bifidobacterium catulorum]|uniref:DNA 3'-5' helicase n=1 Tax=Bifidobacterium catulorum TaxID=1630173 RepID=A0A2U2MQD8_9BIFI|nr:UvrD-helicase domain-containing protein [Bifidobacterium catulorum]PWG59085.1 hypothetical protein DF200_09475 [Bifidobacterium catulorum]